MGIIDTFTEYNVIKKGEHFIKSIQHGPTISCIPPEAYGQRFYDFIEKGL